MHYVDPDMCTGCGLCAEVCAPRAISVINGLASINSAICTSCGRCVDACPAEAILVLEMIPENALPAAGPGRVQEHVEVPVPSAAMPGTGTRASTARVPDGRSRTALLDRLFSGLLLVADLALDRARVSSARSVEVNGSRPSKKALRERKASCPDGGQGRWTERPGKGRGRRQDRRRGCAGYRGR